MVNTVIKALREENNYERDQIAAVLEISVNEYDLLEVGVSKLSYEQAGILGKFYGIDPKHLLGIAESVNYNIGKYSRTVYAQTYHEGEEKPENESDGAN